MTEFYFAYGSNMNPQRMRVRGVACLESTPGRLAGYELCFDKRAVGKPRVAHANIRHRPGAVVEGVLYRLEQPGDMIRLDHFEGAPVRYSREVYTIESQSGSVSAWVYIGNRAMLEADLLPERGYLDHLLAGQAWISPSYYGRLLSQPCADLQHDAEGERTVVHE